MNVPPNFFSDGKRLAIATPIAILATLAFNTLSNIAPPNGINIGQLSNTVLRGVLITPANYAFAIWGLIYVGLIAYGIYQIRPVQQGDETMLRVDQLLILACIAQIIWVYLFTSQQFWASVPVMLVILGSLVQIYLRLGIGRVRVDRRRRWMVHIPFSVYLGWISVATIVNIASALHSSGWDGAILGAESWTAVMIVVATAIALIVVWQREDTAFMLVFIWAYLAIVARQPDVQKIWGTAAVGAIALVIGLSVRQIKQKENRFN